jgi:DNA processing protein
MDNTYENISFPFFMLSHIPFIKEDLMERLINVTDNLRSLNKNSLDKLKKYNLFTDSELSKIGICLKSEEIYKKDYEKMFQKNIKMLSLKDPYYPGRLKLIPDPPFFLFYIGSLPTDEEPLLSVIGARECSFYGEEAASMIGELCGKRRIQLISGMARGIDSIAQKACINAGGYSVGVLGGGPDICYPKESGRLYEDLINKGCILSEHPVGVKPVPFNFVMRNRIISGLSDAVCVIEAKEKSGTLITVDAALEQGKDVYALPGRIYDRVNKGCNRLIKQGAEIILSPEEFIEEFLLDKYNISDNKKKASKKEVPNDLTYEEKLIYEYVDENAFTPDEISRNIPLDPNTILVSLLNLSAKGLLINMGSMRFRKSFL